MWLAFLALNPVQKQFSEILHGGSSGGRWIMILMIGILRESSLLARVPKGIRLSEFEKSWSSLGERHSEADGMEGSRWSRIYSWAERVCLLLSRGISPASEQRLIDGEDL